MRFRLLISCAIAALLAAGCSGGGGGGSSILQPSSAGAGSSKATQPVSITLDRSAAGSSSFKRNAKFVAASVNDVSYAFVQGDTTVVSGDVALNNTNCVNNVCTVTINAVPIGTYTLNLTLNDSGTAVGSGSSSITVALGGTNSAAVTIAPILTGGSAGPSISIPTSAPVFYIDNEGTQTLSASVNELDPVGDIICGSTKSVPNWPTITVSASPETSGLSIPSPMVSTPPACPGATGNVAITYNNNSEPLSVLVGHAHALSVVNTSTVTISASDGTSSKSVTIPFVSLSNSQTTTLDIVDAVTANNVTITETNGSSAGETGFTVTGCGLSGEAPDVSIGTATAFSQGTSGSPSTETISVTGAVTAVDSSCSLTIASNVHPALTTTVSLSIAPSVGVSISSRLRAPAR